MSEINDNGNSELRCGKQNETPKTTARVDDAKIKNAEDQTVSEDILTEQRSAGVIYEPVDESDSEYELANASENEDELHDKPESGEEQVNESDREYELNNEPEIGDETDVDGPIRIIKKMLHKKKSYYRPRYTENGDCESCADIKPGKEVEKQEFISQPFDTSECESKWREGLMDILKDCQSEEDMRKALLFLLSNATNGMDMLSDVGYGGFVNIETDSAPECMHVNDWIKIMDGLKFELTSPNTVRSINYVDVSIGKQTDAATLGKFCTRMRSMLGLAWEDLQQLRDHVKQRRDLSI